MTQAWSSIALLYAIFVFSMFIFLSINVKGTTSKKQMLHLKHCTWSQLKASQQQNICKRFAIKHNPNLVWLCI